MNSQEMFCKQLETLHQEGTVYAAEFAKKTETEPFEMGYQRWYSRALPLMKELAPERYAEFQAYYLRDPHGPEHRRWAYVIRDYILGREPSTGSIEGRKETTRCFTSQLAILKSVADRLSWMSLDTEDQAERGLQLDLLETARDLIKVEERAAGALAGTILEAYLRKLAAKHEVKLRKQSPSPAELVEALKTAKVLDVPAWSQCTWLADLRARNLKAEGQPLTKLQVRDLIDGTRWLITNVF